jgi:hypothetical protein
MSHCGLQIHTGKLEGINKKSKQLQGKHYAFTTFAVLH